MNTATKLLLPGAPPILAVRADYVYKDTIKAQGGRWDPVEKHWRLPYTPDAWQSLYMSIPVTPDAAILAELTQPETPDSRPLPSAPPMPLKPGIRPYKHQQEAYARALEAFGCL